MWPGYPARARAEANLRFEFHDLLALLAEAVDAEGDHVAGLEIFRFRLDAEPDPRWRAGSDDVAWLQHAELRAVPDEVAAVEDHVLGGAALALLAVDVEPHVQDLRILVLVLGDQPRAERPERFAALAFDLGAADGRQPMMRLTFALGKRASEWRADLCLMTPLLDLPIVAVRQRTEKYRPSRAYFLRFTFAIRSTRAQDRFMLPVGAPGCKRRGIGALITADPCFGSSPARIQFWGARQGRRKPALFAFAGEGCSKRRPTSRLETRRRR